MKEWFKGLTSIIILQIGAALVSVMLLILSFTKPGFYLGRAESPDGWADTLFLFFMGWTAFLGGNFIGFIIWVANPLYVFAIIYMFRGQRGKAVLFSLLAVALAFCFSLLDTFMGNEAGTYYAIASLQAGYWLWLASLITLAAGFSLVFFAGKKMQG